MKRYFLLGLMFLGLLTTRGQDGSLDPTFKGKGWTTINFIKSGNVNNEIAQLVLRQSDGRYIVLTESGYFVVLSRYTADGALDKTFGADGFSFPIDLSFVHTAVVQPDNKIVVGGVLYNSTTERYELALERYTSEGEPDSDFGSGGITSAGFDAYYVSDAFALTLQSDGKILAVGQAGNGDPEKYGFALARFTSNGVLDASFNPGGTPAGTLALDFGTDKRAAAYAVGLQSDNKIIVAGQSQDLTTYEDYFTLVRLLNDGTSDGTVDESFGTAGWVKTSFGQDAFLTSLAIQKDDKIVAGGFFYNTTTGNNDFTVARYTSGGTLDTDFNPAGSLPGTVVTDLGGYDLTYALALDGERIVLAGSQETQIEGGGQQYAIALVRYTGSGALDESFDGDGKVITSLEGDDEARAVLVLADSRLLVAGKSFTTSSNTADVLLARYLNDGTLDNTFNPSGTLPGISLSYYAYGIQTEIRDMVVQPDGKLVVAGASPKDFNYYIFGAARFNPDGTLDATFGNGGVAVADFGYSAGAASVALQPDGKIVLGGGMYSYNEAGDNNDFALARFTREGVLDATFSGDGMATADFYSSDALIDIAIQADGKIIGVGEAYDPYEPEGGYYTLDFALVRFNANGTVDTRFGKAGLVTTDFFGYDDHAAGVAIQPDGKIVVSGGVNHPDPATPDLSVYDFAVVRYNSNGILDPRFGTAGKALTTTGTAIGGANLVLQGDAKMVVGGTVKSPGSDPNNFETDFGLVRFTSAGLPDNTFGTGGLVTTDFGGQSEYALPVLLQSDGKLLLCGTYYAYDGGTGASTDYFALVRYLNDGALDPGFGTGGKASLHFDNGLNYSGAATWHNDRVYMAGYWRMPELSALSGFPPYQFESALVTAIRASSTVAPLPVVSIADASVDEGTAASLSITLSIPATVPVTVNYATQDGTAASKGRNADYKSTKGSVTIAAGSSSATISVPTYFNGPGDDGQYFYVNLSLSFKMTGVALMGDDQAKVTLNELPVTLAGKAPAEQEPGRFAATAYPNPTAGSFTLQLQGAANAPVTIRVTDGGGRVVEARTGVAANSSLQLGHHYRPGVYYIYVQQGSHTQTLKLVKNAQ